MGFKTKIQCINRKTSEQFFICIPSAIAQAMNFSKGQTLEWEIFIKDAILMKKPKLNTETEEQE